MAYRQPRFTRPPGATELLLVRHGESRAADPANPFPLVDGQGDPELHPAGRAQAEAVAARLQHLPLAALYATKLQRTRETAAPTAALLGCAVDVDPDLHEVHLGAWEGGLFRRKVAELDPVYLEMQRQQRWDVIPGGESPEALDARLSRALARLHRAHPDTMIAAFVHGGVIAHLLHLATGSERFAFTGAENGSLSQLLLTAEGIKVRSFNEVSHLAHLEAGDGRMT